MFDSAKSHDKKSIKRKKVEHGKEVIKDTSEPSGSETDSVEERTVPVVGDDDAMIQDDIEDEDGDNNVDPFKTQFVEPEENTLSKKIRAAAESSWDRCQQKIANSGKFQLDAPAIGDSARFKTDAVPIESFKLKRRLQGSGKSILSSLMGIQKLAIRYLFEYHDLLLGGRTVQNAISFRQVYCLHALNHVLKTRDRVIKNNAKLAGGDGSEDLDLRDQGFTRPKVLMLLETRQSCVRAVECISRLFEPEQQENRKRFQDGFSQTDHKFSDDRPEDFRELFEGNDDNDFRLGMKFTRKTIKFFSKFYNSDIIFASPLGLRRSIGSE